MKLPTHTYYARHGEREAAFTVTAGQSHSDAWAKAHAMYDYFRKPAKAEDFHEC